jgi:hypothetical protein
VRKATLTFAQYGTSPRREVFFGGFNVLHNGFEGDRRVCLLVAVTADRYVLFPPQLPSLKRGGINA